MTQRPTISLWLLIASALAIAACAGDTPYRTAFDASGGETMVAVLGDGFVRSEGERVPLEAAVLSLRQRTRAMTKEDRHRFVVHLKAEPHAPTRAAKARTAADLNRLLDHLYIMGVTQVRYL